LSTGDEVFLSGDYKKESNDIMIFKNKILMIGYGSVARCVLPVLLKHISIPYQNITIVDFMDKRKELSPWIKRGVNFSQERITPLNISQVLSEHVLPGGIIIDLSWNIDCIEMLNWCHDNKVLYINTSVEQWDPTRIFIIKPRSKSLYIIGRRKYRRWHPAGSRLALLRSWTMAPIPGLYLILQSKDWSISLKKH